jgi:hypothetical protein
VSPTGEVGGATSNRVVGPLTPHGGASSNALTWALQPLRHIGGPDSVRFSLCLPEVGRLEDSTIPSGPTTTRSKNRATGSPGHPVHPMRLGLPVGRLHRGGGRAAIVGTVVAVVAGLKCNGEHRPIPTDNPPEVHSIAADQGAQGAPPAPGSPPTSPGASRSTIRGRRVPTSASARSKGGFRPTTASRCRVPSGPSASLVPAHGDIRDSTVRNPVEPVSAPAGSGSMSGTTRRKPSTGRPWLGGGRDLAQNRPGGDSSSSASVWSSPSSSSSRSTSVSSM